MNIKLLNTTKNPFINLIVSKSKNTNHSNNDLLDNETITAITTLIELGVHQHYSVNEPFFYAKEHGHQKETIIAHATPFYLLSLLNTYIDYKHTGKDFYELLFKSGLDPTSEIKLYNMPNSYNSYVHNTYETIASEVAQHGKLIKTDDSVFSRMELSEERNIFFMDHICALLSEEKYVERVEKYSSLHRAVILNKHQIIDFFAKQHLDINMRDSDMRTPLMFAKNMETLNLVDSYSPKWLCTDIENKDALSYFLHVQDKAVSSQMQQYAQQRIHQAVIRGETNSNVASSDYVETRLKTTLLEMVKADKTKKELEEFLKKNQINNIDSIVDAKGNNLAMLCIKDNNWARYKLFSQYSNITHSNQYGWNVAHQIMMKTHPHLTRKDDAAKILIHALESKCHEIPGKNFGWEMIISLLNNGSFSHPTWLGMNDLNKVCKLFHIPEKVSGPMINKMVENRMSYHGNSETLKEASVEFYINVLQHNESKDLIDFSKLNSIKEKIISYKLAEHPLESRNRHYEIHDDYFENMNRIITQMKSNPVLQKYVNQEWCSQFYGDLIAKINEGYNLHQKQYAYGSDERTRQSKNDFASKVKDILEFYLDNLGFSSLQHTPKELLLNEQFNNEFLVKMRYHLLSSDLETKEHVKTKRAKI